MAVYVITRTRGKKNCCAGNVFGFAPATGRYALENLTIACFVGLQRGCVSRAHVSGSDRVHVNPVPRPFVCKRLRELRDAALGRAVGGPALQGHEGRHRARVDDVRPATRAAQVRRGALWLDVRYPSEYQYDKLPGAINVPLAEVRNMFAVLDRSKDYIAYCQSGRRSAAAAFLFAQRGFKVWLLEGGLKAVEKPEIR